MKIRISILLFSTFVSCSNIHEVSKDHFCMMLNSPAMSMFNYEKIGSTHLETYLIRHGGIFFDTEIFYVKDSNVTCTPTQFPLNPNDYTLIISDNSSLINKKYNKVEFEINQFDTIQVKHIIQDIEKNSIHKFEKEFPIELTFLTLENQKYLLIHQDKSKYIETIYSPIAISYIFNFSENKYHQVFQK